MTGTWRSRRRFRSPAEEAPAALLAQALSALDGFGTVTAVFFPVSADVSVDAGAAAAVVDLEGSDPPRAFPLLYRAATRQLVAVAPPGTVLREHHRYGCVVSGGVHDSAGRALRPSKAMADLLAGGPTAPGGLSAAGRQSRSAATGATPEAATAFTTQTVSAWATKALADLAAMPPVATPTRTFPPGPELDDLFGGPGHHHASGIAAVRRRAARARRAGGRGDVRVARLPVGHAGQMGMFDDGMTVKSVDAVPFMLILPKDAPAGLPVAIFQHGIDGDRSTMLLVADDYTARGYAVLGIDAPFPRQPPARRGRPGQQPRRREPIPDGIGDPPASRWRRSSTSSGTRRWGSRRSIRASCATTSARRPSI